ncbi:accessory Sec system protein translocase subunit SecY2 [Streptococcus sanguinis]|uniref:accessory Sec system protein translocase subunit SecY2 n=1 Tax=Streptococcus sanguinis TaxID=1305 RepID=UPI001CBF700D|nr:accessory Sec system protein translocase subunit SecY2 [Streptococcus sanguinis]MBZ2020080.1 accessory Sec system protein translocase subunit SecY2 [Streptococcus sanguinis]MBZ2068214.1 accessory Sec system protein translocase subunit SecY2 [Streptococcus sanguinis]MBZ2074119.1 accessory Sec system protein translocase subunit SecY2 [Streptococcus sanguinis]MBZ2082151.1 accessory Sec system protein translocase subunit SecY2 [Streptococcus sanguinis]MCC3165413.1 accessory Sec system transloca
MKSFFKPVIIKKFLWTLFFLFIYVLGTKLTLPFVDMSKAAAMDGTSTTLNYATALMGGNLRSMSLFSVGLSPWMSSMLIWQMFAVSKRLGLSKLPMEVQERRRMLLTLVIALIQSVALVLNLPLQEAGGVDMTTIMVLDTLVLMAGTYFLIWLTDLNAAMGLGGSIMIVMASMIAYIPQDIWNSIQELKISSLWLALMLVFSLVFLYLAVTVERSKYRIPVNKINIHNRFKKYSYLDIRLNPAGGMPIMYAMTLVSIPQYFLLIIHFLQPDNQLIDQWIEGLSMGSPAWFILYLLTIFILALAFAFINISGDQIAERMQKSGEYIENVYPGGATRRYINGLVTYFALVGAFYLILISGLPMMVVLLDIRYLRLSMIPGIFMIFIGMVFSIKDEVDALTLNDRYRSLL